MAANRLATRNVARPPSPLRAAIASARRTRGALPSMPVTVAPRRAIGSVKLPRPQKKSATRSPGRGSSRLIARRTSTRLIAGLTCVNSVGRIGKHEPEFRQRVGERRVGRVERNRGLGAARLQPEADAVRVGEPGQRRFVASSERLEDAQHEHAGRIEPVAVAPSPMASSICGRRSRIVRAPTSERSAGSSADTLGGSTAHDVMSAT